MNLSNEAIVYLAQFLLCATLLLIQLLSPKWGKKYGRNWPLIVMTTIASVVAMANFIITFL